MVERGEAADGKPTGLGSKPDGKKSEEELGDGQGEVGGPGGDFVDPAAGTGGGEHGKGDGEAPGEQEGAKGKKNGGGGALGDELGDGDLVSPGVSEIQTDHVAQPAEVLFVPRAVEAEGFLELSDEGGVDIALGLHGSQKIAGSKAHQGEDEQGDREEHGHERAEAAKNESGHGMNTVQSSSRFQTREPRGGILMFCHRSFRPT